MDTTSDLSPPAGANPQRSARAAAEAELGLGQNPTREEVRAAYLRLLKTRKPEVDPDGFQRLRAAYELLREEVDVSAAAFSTEGFAREPVTVPAQGPNPSAVEREPLRTEGEGIETAASAEASVEATAEAMAAAYAEALTGAQEALPPPWLALQTMLRLHELADTERALVLGRSLYAWLQATGTESHYLGGAVAVLWAVLRDLAMLPPEAFPFSLRAAVARATREGDLLRAREAFIAYRERSRTDGANVAFLLGTHAPTLSAVLGGYLVYAPRTSKLSGRGVAMFAFVAFNILRLCLGSWTPSAPETKTPYVAESERPRRVAIDAALAGLARAVEGGDCAEIEESKKTVSETMHADGAWPTENQRATLTQLERRGRRGCPKQGEKP